MKGSSRPVRIRRKTRGKSRASCPGRVAVSSRAITHKPHRYEPVLNTRYQEMAADSGMAILPARVRKPRDKAKVEVAVQLVERWVLARLRHRTFSSLAELNAEIAVWLEQLNTRPLRKLPGSRRSQFEQLDRPALRALPTARHVFADWKRARVPIDYHLEVAHHFYSVPYVLVGQALDVRLTATTLEVFHRGERVAAHARAFDRGRYSTLPEHRPKAHREYAQWSPPRLIA